MAVSLPSVKGGKRSLDAELNLVPFIDLLSMCICFLLMTAVWVQTASIEVKQSHGTSADTAKPEKIYEIDVRFSDENRAELSLRRGNVTVKKTQISAPDARGFSDATAKILAEMLKNAGPQGGLAVSAARLSPNPRVNYGQLVTVMDILRSQKVTSIGVMPAGGSK